ncbi:MAG: SGNH/GDSL hydrolase family protein [Verrucomicrobia bacterium]|nr:SGNH/GDSL hydrolase family protein [Verrucomicrobiota bacterium]
MITPLAAQPVPAVLFTARNGLPNTRAILERGGELTVVFIGGSVTQGGGAAGYVASTGAWLSENWPDAEIRAVNAGISGTGSDFGAKRYDRDVLVHKPDLVFIEFAVNDGQSDSRAHMERMVHKTWLQNPEADLVFFYNLSRAHLENYRNGELPRAAGFHEQVAIHYGIPTISLGHGVAAKLEAGDIEWSQFAHDAVHPHAGGYGLYNEIFREVLPELLQRGEPGPHTLREPLTPNLVVYPPPVEAVPQHVPVFQDANGQPAIKSFAAPSPGVHWIEEPVFAAAEGKTLWRLHWMDKVRSAAMDETLGRNKADWAPNPMQWFAEERAFTGPEGNPLYSRAPDGDMLGFSGREVTVLVFVAPETGRYAFRVGSDRLQAWQNEDTDFALHVLSFPWGEEEGTSHILYRARRREVVPFTREGDVHLTAGEELIFVAGSNTPGHIRGGWANFQVHIGLMARD